MLYSSSAFYITLYLYLVSATQQKCVGWFDVSKMGGLGDGCCFFPMLVLYIFPILFIHFHRLWLPLYSRGVMCYVPEPFSHCSSSSYFLLLFSILFSLSCRHIFHFLILYLLLSANVLSLLMFESLSCCVFVTVCCG